LGLLNLRVLKDRWRGDKDELVRDALVELTNSYVSVNTAISGLMQLESLELLQKNAAADVRPKQVVLALPFLHEILRLFAPKASSSGVTLSSAVGTLEDLPVVAAAGASAGGNAEWNSSVRGQALPLTDADMLYASRPSLAQALRVITSYAITRATARDGGSVRVCAGFVPGRVLGSAAASVAGDDVMAAGRRTMGSTDDSVLCNCFGRGGSNRYRNAAEVRCVGPLFPRPRSLFIPATRVMCVGSTCRSSPMVTSPLGLPVLILVDPSFARPRAR